MITKGIIEKVDGYKALVRLPIYNNSAASKHSTKTEDLPKATFCSLPNIEIPFAKGDIVFVGFEDNDTNKPIILGHLYKAEGNPATPGLNLSTLKTTSSTKLSNNTWIGDVTPNELSALSGIKGNIQKQIDNLLSNTSASNNSSGDVDLSEIEESIQNEVSQRRLQDIQLNTRINDLQSLITNHNHDSLYSSINHNHDNRYLNLSGGHLLGNVSLEKSRGLLFNTNSDKYLIYGDSSSENIYFEVEDSNQNKSYYKFLDKNGKLYSDNKEVSTIDHSHDLLYAPLNHSHDYLPLSGGTITGNLTISGTITQQGSAYETHAEKVYSKKDYIYLRDGQTGGLANGDYSGFEFVKYDGTNNGRLVVDNEGTARVGDVGDERPLATRDESSNLTDKGLAIWDGSTYSFKTSSIFTIDNSGNLLAPVQANSSDTGKDNMIRIPIITGTTSTESRQIAKVHGIELGMDGRNYLNLNEYGGIFNFYKTDEAFTSTGDGDRVAQISPEGISIQDKIQLHFNDSTNALEFKFL